MADGRTERPFILNLFAYPLIVGVVMAIQAMVLWERMKGWYVQL